MNDTDQHNPAAAAAAVVICVVIALAFVLAVVGLALVGGAP